MTAKKSQRTYQRYLKRDNPIFSEVVRMSKKANNLYNQAMWLMEHEKKVHGKTLSYGDLDKITKQLPSSYNNYRLLPAQSAQQTLRQRTIKNIPRNIKPSQRSQGFVKREVVLPFFFATNNSSTTGKPFEFHISTTS